MKNLKDSDIIIEATSQNTLELSKMLYEMYNEVQPLKATKDIKKYEKLLQEHLENDLVFIDSKNRGFFIMRDISIPVIDEVMWEGVSVYIKPEFRKTKLLSKMYKYMFKNFIGDIIGFTDYNSNHNEILQKRHDILGIVYILNRPKDSK